MLSYAIETAKIREAEVSDRTLASFIASILAVVSVILLLVGLTNVGELKDYRFIVASAAMLTAIAYAFLAGCRKPRFILFWFIWVAMWFVLGILNFEEAVWSVGSICDILSAA